MNFFLILQLIYFMLPAYFANMAPVISRFSKWNYPLDLNIKYCGKSLLGEHKTIIGGILGIITATLTTFVQHIIYLKTGFGFIDYSNWQMLGVLFGIGVIFGDALKSFFKRRMNFKPGQSWIPFDQIDFTIGALIFISPSYFLGWTESIVIILISAVGHIIVNHTCFYLGLRPEKW